MTNNLATHIICWLVFMVYNYNWLLINYVRSSYVNNDRSIAEELSTNADENDNNLQQILPKVPKRASILSPVSIAYRYLTLKLIVKSDILIIHNRKLKYDKFTSLMCLMCYLTVNMVNNIVIRFNIMWILVFIDIATTLTTGIRPCTVIFWRQRWTL